ncbi:MAG TPA: RNA polymerase sigma factor [Pyrinomonadaceae bacterium]|jgi:RNA polymerase sigma-70 factor (ECF subfamily)
MADDQDLEHEIFCVLRAQSGSHEALNELFKLLQEPLFRYLKNLVREEFKAEDILQEVFIRIYRKLRWLREPRALRSWAFQIATREAFRYLKREKHFHETSDEEFLVQTPSSETENFPREMIEQLPGLIGNLSPASRAVIVLYYLNELSLNETAAVLEIPVGTVKSRLAYGLAKLRRELET